MFKVLMRLVDFDGSVIIDGFEFTYNFHSQGETKIEKTEFLYLSLIPFALPYVRYDRCQFTR